MVREMGEINLEFVLNNLIRAKSKRQEILKILTQSDPTHQERLYLAGFLGFILKDPELVFELIDLNNRWENYNPRITRNQVYSVFRTSYTLSSFLEEE